MFEIVGSEEFKSKYIDKEDCAGINFMSNNLKYGNMVFLKKIDGSSVYYGLSQILYFIFFFYIIIILSYLILLPLRIMKKLNSLDFVQISVSFLMHCF